jgi:hypothetical protein
MIEKFTAFVSDKRVIFAFVALVCTLIFITPLYSPPVVPQPGGWAEHSSKSELQGIYIVEDARPSKFTDEVLKHGIQFVEAETGWTINEVKIGPMPTETCGGWDAEGWSKNRVTVPCKKGWIVVLQDDALLTGAPTDGKQTHGRTFLPAEEDEDGYAWPIFPQNYATIVLTDGSLEPDDPNSECSLPANAYANLWTHELLHGLGYNHTFTRIIPGVNAITMERTGHILNDNLCDGGWNGVSLDTWDSSRKRSYEKPLGK